MFDCAIGQRDAWWWLLLFVFALMACDTLGDGKFCDLKLNNVTHSLIYILNCTTSIWVTNNICIYIAIAAKNAHTHRAMQSTTAIVIETHGISYLNRPTSSPILPFSDILIGFEWFEACINVVKWLMPISSSDDFLRPDIPTVGKPWRNELDRRSNMSLSICFK